MPSCRARGEASGEAYDVFISDAGTRKGTFAVWLQRELRRHGIDAFLAETSLRPGDAADVEREAALRSCSIVVAVLTPDYLRSAYCMLELHWALHPSEPHPPLLQKSAMPAMQQSTAGHTPRDAQLHSITVQRSKGPPYVLPVFYHSSNIHALQQSVEQQLAKAHITDAPPGTLQRLQQAGADLAAVCGFAGDRLDSHGK